MTRSRHEAIRRRHVTRLLALWLAITLVPTALAAPSDITETSAPELGQSAPAAQTISAGDFSVATQTGAATYTFPLRTPPARSVGPRFSLTYSSQAAIYGVASGWNLEIPSVMYDTSRARFRNVHYAGTAEPEWDDEPYISTLSGGRPLVKVTGDVPGTNAFVQCAARQQCEGLTG